MTIIAGTGHRPDRLGGYGDAVAERLIALATASLREQKPSTVISGMALGWDMALAEAAFRLGIPFHAYLPFVGQEAKWRLASQQQFQTLLGNASVVVECCDPGYASWKMHRRNEYMVEACDVLLALWDGSNSGTGNCIAYARNAGRKVINLWSRYHA